MEASTEDIGELQQASSTLVAALPLLLTHLATCEGTSSSIQQQQLLQLVCTLLATSKSCSEAIHSTSRSGGFLHLCLEPKDSAQAGSFARWMFSKQHPQLLACLSLDISSTWRQPGESKHAAEAAVAQALAAASSTGTLQLQAFACLGTPGWLLLQHLPANSLTSLSVDCSDLSSSSRGSKWDGGSDVEWLQQELLRLTGLQQLELCVSVVDDDDDDAGSSSSDDTSSTSSAFSRWRPECMLPSLSQLGQLTRLKLEQVESAAALMHLPVQLRELELTFARQPLQQQRDEAEQQGMQQQLRLSHLTALTRLIANEDSSSGYVIQPGDQLPPRLLQLHVVDCRGTVQPLLELRRLQQLTMANSTTPAVQLQQLAQCLTQLTDVGLRYRSSAAVGAAAAAWPVQCLPLHRLLLRMSHSELQQALMAPVVQQLGRLQHLTRLDIKGFENKRLTDVTQQQLFSAVAQLTGLQQMTICNVRFAKPPAGSAALSPAEEGNSGGSDDLDDEAAAAAAALSRATAGDAALSQLGGLQQLKCLQLVSLHRMYATWQGLADLLMHLTALEELSLSRLKPKMPHRTGSTSTSDNISIRQEGGEVLMAAIAQLPVLKQLSLYELPVSSAAASTLACSPTARKLQHLKLSGCELGIAAAQALANSCTKLTSLELSCDANVGDASLECICQHLQQLQHLCVDRTAVTDAGTLQLSSLSNLTSLEVPTGVERVSHSARMAALRMPRWVVERMRGAEDFAAAVGDAENLELLMEAWDHLQGLEGAVDADVVSEDYGDYLISDDEEQQQDEEDGEAV
jgi:hypothetical protein